ncbi:hypothetical protein BH18ACT10_BH18ACT10_14030 [soil metagenome]
MSANLYTEQETPCPGCGTEWKFHIEEGGTRPSDKPVACPECGVELPVKGTVLRQFGKRGSKWVQAPLDLTG